MKRSIRIVFEIGAFLCVIFLILQNFSLHEQIQKGHALREKILDETKYGALIRSQILKQMTIICNKDVQNEGQ